MKTYILRNDSSDHLIKISTKIILAFLLEHQAFFINIFSTDFADISFTFIYTQEDILKA